MVATSPRRVVITGLGVISPLGLDVQSLWNCLENQQSGIRPIQSLPQGVLPVHAGGECVAFTGAAEDFGPIDGLLKRSIRKNQKVMCREIEMGVAAAQRALIDSALTSESRDPDRVGVAFASDFILTRPEEFSDGVAKCRDESLEFVMPQWPERGLPEVNPLWLLKFLPNMPASHVAIFNDLRGPNNSVTVREAGHNLVIAEASAMIRRGRADAMLVGATGCRINPLRSLHITMQEKLASDRSNASEMCRPFDRSRDGLVLGEGAGAILLEDYEHAKRRGAKIWGEVLGASSTMVGPRPGRNHYAVAVANTLGATLRNAIRQPKSLHIHAHGLSSVQSDAAEAEAIRGMFASVPPVVAAKSYFGNLGAGSAAVELISSCLALQHGKLFSTLNYQQGDAGNELPIAQSGTPSGDGFLHVSITPQGQASSVLIGRVDD